MAAGINSLLHMEGVGSCHRGAAGTNDRVVVACFVTAIRDSVRAAGRARAFSIFDGDVTQTGILSLRRAQ